MRRVLPLLALGVGLGAMALSRGAYVPALTPAPAPAASRRTAAPQASASPFRLVRNPFAYADAERSETRADPSPVEEEARAPVVSIAPPPVRLVGFVYEGDLLKAALVIADEIVLLGVGESASGYKVRSADEVDGVSLETPDGFEMRVGLPE